MSYVPTFTNDAELDALIASMLADIAPADVVRPAAAPVAAPVPVAPVLAAPAPAVPRARVWNVSWRKVGGLTFVRVGRLSMSFCLTRKPV
ncbi:hypothetical protein [Mesorhizobium silamurunense]|uniref:hypothetical protein n=1 Tax=Mesorhizobium silamurunense TaxID=499528 RepID=UPI001786D15C|nr:hypothetical protein [Mesorhizobium silamurunense]